MASKNWLWNAVFESGDSVLVPYRLNDDNLFDLFIPCSRNMKGAWKEIKSVFPIKKGQKIMGIPGMDLLNHKLRLPMYLKKKDLNIFPPSWDVKNSAQMKSFYADETLQFEHYILKSFKHLQKGLLVVKGKEGVRNALSSPSKHILLQPVLTPNLLKDREGKPTSLRIYVMVVCSVDQGMRVLYHPWIRVKYAGATNEKDIATNSNFPGPSNLKDFCLQEKCSVTKLTKLFEDLLKRLFEGVRGEMCDSLSQYNSKGVFFQLFGADIVISKDMKRAWLLEMNKGPNMSRKEGSLTGPGKRRVAGAFFRTVGAPTIKDDGDPMDQMVPLLSLPVYWQL